MLSIFLASRWLLSCCLWNRKNVKWLLQRAQVMLPVTHPDASARTIGSPSSNGMVAQTTAGSTLNPVLICMRNAGFQELGNATATSGTQTTARIIERSMQSRTDIWLIRFVKMQENTRCSPKTLIDLSHVWRIWAAVVSSDIEGLSKACIMSCTTYKQHKSSLQ